MLSLELFILSGYWLQGVIIENKDRFTQIEKKGFTQIEEKGFTQI